MKPQKQQCLRFFLNLCSNNKFFDVFVVGVGKSDFYIAKNSIVFFMLAKFLFFSKNDLPNLLREGFCITWQNKQYILIIFDFFSFLLSFNGGTLVPILDPISVPTSCCTVDVLWNVVVAAAAAAAVFLDS